MLEANYDEKQDSPYTYLAHHELESVNAVVLLLRCAGSNHTTNRALSSRGSTATGSTPTGVNPNPSLTPDKALHPYCDAEAWLQQGEYLALRGTYRPAKVYALVVHGLAYITLADCVLELCWGTATPGCL